MHTAPVDQNGTNLIEVQKRIAPDCDIKFSTDRINQEQLNWLYNLSDCTINIAGNEGFGLTTAESIMAGTPAIINVTGGLQDQCGFKVDGKYLTAEDYKEIGSLHNYRDWEDKVTHGEWVKPVWPRVQTMVGSVPTPYIIDDKVDVYEVADAIKYWYDKKPKERKEAGLVGRKEFMGEMGLNAKNQNQKMADGILKAIENWKPKQKFNVYKLR
jgi:glycosyltransferase involved in cell wall biosynthesis